MSSFDKLIRAHRRDKAGRKAGRKRKRKRGPEGAAAAGDNTGEDGSAGGARHDLPPSLRVGSLGTDAADNTASASSSTYPETRALAYSAPYSGARFEAYQSRLTKADRAWQRPFTFTKDWHSRHVAYWSHHLKPFVNKPCNYLEIGCFEGLSTVWMLSHVLTNPSSQLTVCDTFCGVQGQNDIAETTRVTSQTRMRFDDNISRCPGTAKPIRLFATMSCNMFAELLSLNPNAGAAEGPAASDLAAQALRHRPEYDLIYVDGSHVARDVLLDAVCGFALLRVGGLIMFDDYQWKLLPEEYNCPGLGIDVFRSCFQAHIEIVHLGYQFFCRKISNAPRALGSASCSGVGASETATVSSNWIQCFDKCTTSDTPCDVLQLGGIPKHLSEWLATNKRPGTTITPCAIVNRETETSESEEASPTSTKPASSSPLASSVSSRMDADTFLSLMLHERKGSPKFDFIILGDVGGDPATALRALVIAWGLLRIGGDIVAPKPMAPTMQLAVDGLCDCYEPHMKATPLNSLRELMCVRKLAGPDVVGLEKNV